jgi:hypothetical protein
MQHLSNSPRRQASGFARCDRCWGPRLPGTVCGYCGDGQDLPAAVDHSADMGLMAMYGMYGNLASGMHQGASEAWQQRAEAAEAENVEFREKVSTKAMQIVQLKDENTKLTNALRAALTKLEELEKLETSQVSIEPVPAPCSSPGVGFIQERAWDDPVNWRMPGGIPNGLFSR